MTFKDVVLELRKASTTVRSILLKDALFIYPFLGEGIEHIVLLVVGDELGELEHLASVIAHVQLVLSEITVEFVGSKGACGEFFYEGMIENLIVDCKRGVPRLTGPG